MSESDNGTEKKYIAADSSELAYRVRELERFGDFTGKVGRSLDAVVDAVRKYQDYTNASDGKRQAHGNIVIRRIEDFNAILDSAVKAGVVRAEDAREWSKPVMDAMGDLREAELRVQRAAQQAAERVNRSESKYRDYLQRIENFINEVMGIGKPGGNF